MNKFFKTLQKVASYHAYQIVTIYDVIMLFLNYKPLACVAAVSFPFQAEVKHASERAGERSSMPGVSKKLGRSGEGVSKKGERVARKGITCSQSQTFY